MECTLTFRRFNAISGPLEDADGSLALAQGFVQEAMDAAPEDELVEGLQVKITRVRERLQAGDMGEDDEEEEEGGEEDEETE